MAPSSNRRPGFSRRAQYGAFAAYVLAVAGFVVGLLLLGLSMLNPPAFAALRLTLAEVTTPISSGIAGVGRGIAAVPAGIGDYLALHDENVALRRQVAETRETLVQARTLARDNRRLRALLRVRERIAVPVTTARLVSSSASSTRRFAVINAGSWQGVRQGQPVRGPDGLIGRILEAGPNTARVLLLSDPDSIVPVRRTRDGLPAMASGRGDGMLDIRSAVTANVAFLRGDTFVTSGTGGIYAPDIPVARIVRSARDTALARTFAQPDTLDFAVVQQVYLPEPPAPAPANAPAAAKPAVAP